MITSSQQRPAGPNSKPLPEAMQRGFSIDLGEAPQKGLRFKGVGEDPRAAQAEGRPRRFQLRVVGDAKLAGPETVSAAKKIIAGLEKDPLYKDFEILGEFSGPNMPVHKDNPWRQDK